MRVSRRARQRAPGKCARRPSLSRAGYAAAACAGMFVLAVSPASAQSWRFSSSIGVEETLTNNVNLEPDATRRSDLVSQITPGVSVTEQGARTTLSAQVALPVLIHARTGSESSTLEPQVSVLGKYEAIPRFFFIEGAVSVSQQYLSPFGPRSDSLANATNNRFTSASYRVTPYVKGAAGNDLTYELRDSVTWTNGYGASNLTNNASTNELTGTIARAPTPVGWAVDIDRTDTRYAQQQQNLVSELARARAIDQIDPQLQLSARGGYEHDDYGLTTFNSAIYGLGASWRPTDRTNVDGFWEHRFFGSSYSFSFSHRMPLSVWSLQASRSTTTFPQQLANLPPGADVPAILNQLFLVRVPDPIQRQTIVNQFILDRGLPSVLSSPVALYTQQITLQESLIGTVGLLGARNSVFFSAYRQHNEPIAGPGIAGIAGLSDLLLLIQNNTQYGGGVVWSHPLAPLLTLTASLDGSRTVGTGPTQGSTKQATARAMLATSLSPLTSVFAGIRFQVSRSSVAFDYDEAAIFAGLAHQFR